MQWTPCIVLEFSWFHAAWRNGTLLNAVDLCSKMECSGCYAAWPKASWLNAVDFMQRHLMQIIPYIVVQRIQIVYGGVHAARPNASRLNAVRFMQHGPKHPDWMQCTPCSVVKCIRIECNGLHAGWLNSVDSMQRHWMQRIPCIVAQWIPIVCSGVHAAWWMHGFHAAW